MRSATTVRVALAAHADHAHAPQTQRQRIGDRHDLHHPAVDEALDPLTHRRLRQPDGSAQLGVGQPAVALELLDDGPVDLVDVAALSPFDHAS